MAIFHRTYRTTKSDAGDIWCASIWENFGQTWVQVWKDGTNPNMAVEQNFTINEIWRFRDGFTIKCKKKRKYKVTAFQAGQIAVFAKLDMQGLIVKGDEDEYERIY